MSMSTLPVRKNVLELLKLEDKVAYVTGGGRGLGEAMATALAQAGAAVAVVDIDPETAESTAAEIRQAGGRAVSIKTDVTKAAEVENMIRAVVDAFGRVDIGVNNAGIAMAVPAEEMSEADWRRVVEVNLNAVYFCAREVGRRMIQQGSGGSIVNTASMSGTIVNKGFNLVAYCTTKAGVKHMTKSLAVEWANHGIRVNSISPGYMRTQMIAKSLSDPEVVARNMTSTTPLGRVGEPWDLAGAVVYLASAASSFVTGHDLIIDGGHSVW